MNILLVDDEESILQVVGDFLVDCGHNVVSAGDGAKALNLLEVRGDIGLIVSDIRMPKMNGLDFLRAVRGRFPGTPVILITGHGDENAAVAALQEGAYDYLKKPIKFNEFLTCVERIEDRNRLESQVLEDYKNLLRPGQGSGESPTASNLQIQNAVTSVMDDLQSFEVFWDTLGGHLKTCRSEDSAVQRRVDFILNEMPGLMSDIRRNMERLEDQVCNTNANGVPDEDIVKEIEPSVS